MGARGRGTSAGAILIVDDNAALADNLREILEDAGYQVELAASCAAARQRAGAFHVALRGDVSPWRVQSRYPGLSHTNQTCRRRTPEIRFTRTKWIRYIGMHKRLRY